MKRIELYIFKIFQYLFVFLMLSSLNQFVIGQNNVKYKDVYKVIEEKSKEEAYSLLLVYQKQDPFFANTYLQLGMISQYWSKDYDALTNLRDVEFFIYNTNLYYGLALAKIDQKETRKNEKYYLNVDRFKNREKIEFDEIKSFIQEQIDANNEYSKNVQIVTRLFNSSINHYNNCIRIFKEINTSKNKIKDIYLTANAKFMSDLNELEKSFDSTIYYLQNFQTSIKNYPIKKYNQKYKLLPIETYRLQGMTGSDFLKDEIPIWNYGTWVKNVKQILSTDIEDIRTQINKSDQKLNENIAILAESREFKSDLPKFKVDDKLKFKIGKFDYQSILLELFKFKESKIEFLAGLRDPLNNPKDTTQYSLVQKSRYYESILELKNVCDSLNENLVQKLNPYEINKYSEFISNNYGGEAGLKSYLKNEKGFLVSKLISSMNNFKDYIWKFNLSKQLKTDTFYYKQAPNKQIAVKLKSRSIDFKNAVIDSCYTLDYKVNNTGDFFITGYIKESGNPCYPFVAKSNKRIEIKWLKIISSAQSLNSSGIFIQAKEDGCEVLVHTPLDSLGQNQIYIFDNEGKQKDKIDIGVAAFPRYFSYDEINQKYDLVFKGFKQNQLECLANDLIVVNYDGLLKKENWKQTLKLRGTFVDIFMVNQYHFLVTNFSSYQSDSLTIASKAGILPLQTNAFLFLIDQAGKLYKEVPLLNEKPFYITNCVKSSSNSINLLGFRNNISDMQSISQSGMGELVYLLLNANGELYFDNSKLQ